MSDTFKKIGCVLLGILSAIAIIGFGAWVIFF